MTDTLTLPTIEEVVTLAAHYGISLDGDEAAAYRRLMSGVIHSCGHIASLKAFRPEVKYPRSRGYRPPRIDNPYNAWSWRTEINGASSGPLVGVKTGIKDNICVAGVPMLVGRDEKGFVPDSDATVVTRLLDAGTTILGKTTASDGVGIDDFESNSPFVTVRNPRRPTHAPGGSSSGSAAALVAGDIDLALGSDQGGSVRIPAAWSGVVGLRPSYGLVPYTGLIATEMTMVAVGPLANTVEDIARALNVLAGPDPLDPRQRGIAAPDVDYLSSIGKGAANARIAVVREGFNQAPWRDLGLPGSERVVDQKVRAALERLQARGTTVEEVSVPAHLDGVHVFNAMYNEGNAAMVLANAVGTNFLGYYNTELMEAYGRSWRNDPNSLSPARKSVLITAEFLRQRYHGRYYAQAQNVRDTIRAAYDEVLNRYDVMVTPTVPFRATPIPPADLPPDRNVAYAMQMIANTCQSGVTGHPAISVPCGIAEGLPIGLQIIGRHLDDWTVLRIADAIERLGDWQTF